jgi:uncharacterized membrane protein
MIFAAASSDLSGLVFVPAVVLLSGIVIALVCRPLIQGKVAPNPFYGIRTKLAFSSEENWYRVNRFGGRLMFRAGVFVALVGVAGFLVPVSGLIIYSSIAAALVLMAVLGTAIRILMGPPKE